MFVVTVGGDLRTCCNQDRATQLGFTPQISGRTTYATIATLGASIKRKRATRAIYRSTNDGSCVQGCFWRIRLGHLSLPRPATAPLCSVCEEDQHDRRFEKRLQPSHGNTPCAKMWSGQPTLTRFSFYFLGAWLSLESEIATAAARRRRPRIS